MVKIWGKSNCSFCDKAKELCMQYHLKYEYISVDDIERLLDLHELVPKANTVPQIFWNNKYIGGYTEFASEVENTRSFGQESF